MFCRWTIAEEGSANEAVRCVPSVHAASGGHEVVRLTRCYFGFVWMVMVRKMMWPYIMCLLRTSVNSGA